MVESAQIIETAPPQSAKERGDRLQAKLGNAATARISRQRLEREMDRPPNPKPKRWRSIYSEKKRMEALYLRQSLLFPICMEYAVVTLGLLGLRRKEALEKGLRLGEDQGVDTMVLGDDNWPLPMQRVHASGILGIAHGNVSVTLNWMLATKRYTEEGKRVYIVSDPPELTPEERQKCIQTDTFLDLPKGASELPKEDRDLLRSIADERIRTDTFCRLMEIHLDTKRELELLRSKTAARRKVIHLEARNLIVFSSLPPLPESASSSSGEAPASNGTTTTNQATESRSRTVHAASNGTATGTALDPVLTELRKYGGDIEAAETLVAKCRDCEPDITDKEIVELVQWKAPRATAGKVVGFVLKAVPLYLKSGGLGEWRKQKEDRPAGKCRQCDRTGIWRGESCPMCHGTGWT